MAPWTARGTRTALFVSGFSCICLRWDQPYSSYYEKHLLTLAYSSLGHLDGNVLSCTHWAEKKNNITVYVVFCWMPCGWTGRQFNCYWSHISSKCPPDKPHWCCVSMLEKEEPKTRPTSTPLVERWPFLVKSGLFVPQPPELCNYYVWLITLITLSSFVGEGCDWAEMSLIRYQWQVHPSVTRQMLFIHWLVLILLSDGFKSPCCKSPRGKSQDKTLTAGAPRSSHYFRINIRKEFLKGACGWIQTGLTFHM